MRNFKMMAAVLLLGTSSMALAQDENPEVDEVVEAETEIDIVVETETEVEADLDGIADEDVAGESQGIGLAVSAAARGAAQAEGREGGIAADVLLQTNAKPRAIEAVTAAGSLARQNASAAQANAAAAARSGASAVVETAMTARGNASAVVDQAQAVRLNAHAAAEQAQVARLNAQTAADQARAIREIVAVTPGRGR